MIDHKGVQNVLWAIGLGLISAGIAPAEKMLEPSSDVPITKIEKEAAWQLSILAGGISKHLTTDYEPHDGYTEEHALFGLDISQAGPGWIFSAQAFYFKDSHNEDSYMGAGAFGYRVILPLQFFVYGGLGVGYGNTSYYSGAIVLPQAEIGWWRISAQGTYLPKLPDADSGIGVQFRFKVFEW